MKLCILVLLLCTLHLSVVHSWGPDGHQIVAQIATSFVSPTTMGYLNRMLVGKTLPQIALWPDNYDHSPQGAWSEKFHYVNLPTDAVNFTYAACFPPAQPTSGCVVTGIQNITEQLEYEFSRNQFTVCVDDDDFITAPPCPLSFLVHFLGDTHQPLHVSYDIDAGGNFFDVQYLSTCSNLHSVWDTGLITTYESNNNLNWTDISNKLVNFVKARPEIYYDYLNHTDPARWADETFTLARFVPYNLSPGSVPPSSIWFAEYTTLNAPIRNYPEVPAPPTISCKYPGPILSESYYTRTIPVVFEQLAKAGVRLAYQLNKIYDPSANKDFLNF